MQPRSKGTHSFKKKSLVEAVCVPGSPPPPTFSTVFIRLTAYLALEVLEAL